MAPPPIRVTAQLTLDMPLPAFWHYASDTARVNRAVGIPGWQFEPVLQEDGVTYFDAHTRYLGFTLRWREYPFDWVHERSFRSVREFDRLLRLIQVDTLLEPADDDRTRVRVEVTFLARTWSAGLAAGQSAPTR